MTYPKDLPTLSSIAEVQLTDWDLKSEFSVEFTTRDGKTGLLEFESPSMLQTFTAMRPGAQKAAVRSLLDSLSSEGDRIRVKNEIHKEHISCIVRLSTRPRDTYAFHLYISR